MKVICYDNDILSFFFVFVLMIDCLMHLRLYNVDERELCSQSITQPAGRRKIELDHMNKAKSDQQATAECLVFEDSGLIRRGSATGAVGLAGFGLLRTSRQVDDYALDIKLSAHGTFNRAA